MELDNVQDVADRPQKTVLFAEDEEMVRSVLALSLSRMGVTVLQAKDGVEAVEKLRIHSIDMAILDCHMPRMDGYGVFEEIQRLNLDVPVVMISGDDECAVLDHFDSVRPHGVLIKPVSSSTLHKTVSALMVDSGGAAAFDSETSADRTEAIQI